MIYLVTKQQALFNSGNYDVITVEESLRILKPMNIIGVDTETRGLDPYTKELLSLQLGNFDDQVVVDCTTIDILEYKCILESTDKLFIFWNAKFDWKFLFHAGIVVTNLYDGFLAEKLMWLGYPAGMHSLSLKSAGITYCDVELDKSVRGKIIWAGLTPDVIEYGAYDVKYLERIYLKQQIALKQKGLEKAILVENLFVVPLAYCEYCGIKLDTNKWKAKMRRDSQDLIEAEEACNRWVSENMPNSKYTHIDNQGDLFSGFDLTPKCLVNWNSAKQVIPLFKELGLELKTKDKTTGEYKDSVDAKVLKPQKDKCPLVKLYLKYREIQKVTSTYGDNILKQVNKVSGRIHTSYTQLGADTTRITSGGKDKENRTEYINLLNLPSDGETRGCFVSEEGNKWISIDYSGQETYLMASIANDQAIIKELTEGSGDIHSLTAYIAYPEIPRDTNIKDIKTKYHQFRQDAKGIEFAINYGGDYNTISQNKGIPLEEAKAIYNNYMKGFSGLQRYQAFRRKDWWDKGYILLNPITGHKAYIYDYAELKAIESKADGEEFWHEYKILKQQNPHAPLVEDMKKLWKRKSASSRQSINYPIQATGSMCLRFSMIYFFKYLRTNNLLRKVKICVTPYDEMNVEAPSEIANEVAQELYNCMVKAGAVFCTRCKLDADISWAHKLDENGNEILDERGNPIILEGVLPTYWIH